MTYILYVYTKTDKTNQGLGKLSKNKLWLKGLDSDYKLFFEHPLARVKAISTAHLMNDFSDRNSISLRILVSITNGCYYFPRHWEIKKSKVQYLNSVPRFQNHLI